MRTSLLLILTLGLLGACTRVTVFGHTVKDDGAPAAQPAPAAAGPSASAVAPAVPAVSRIAPSVQPGKTPITRLALEFTPAARQQVDADKRFSVEALRDAVAAELQSRQLLDLQTTGSGTGRIAEIQMEEFTLRATSNLVLFGRLPSVGVLAGTVRIRAAAGGDAQEYRVRADIPLSISKNGTHKHPLQNLYGGFARQLADDITGTPPRPLPRQ
jgi:hypothetical protein